MTNEAQLLAELEVHHAARSLLHEYQRLVDAKDLDGLAEIVIPDVLLARQDGETRGAEQFLALYRKFAASDVQVAHHMVTNVEARELPAEGDVRVVRVDSCFLAITTHASGRPGSSGAATATTWSAPPTGGRSPPSGSPSCARRSSTPSRRWR